MYAEVYNGTYGEHLTYSIDTEDSTHVISGIGDMFGICFGNQYFRNAIKTVVFPEGLTSISSTAFAYRHPGRCGKKLTYANKTQDYLRNSKKSSTFAAAKVF